MDKTFGIFFIAGVCIFILILGALKQKMGFIINFISRAIVGTAAIYFINILCSNQNISLYVGINPLSVLTSGSLGFYGVALLYGIIAIDFL